MWIMVTIWKWSKIDCWNVRSLRSQYDLAASSKNCKLAKKKNW